MNDDLGWPSTVGWIYGAFLDGASRVAHRLGLHGAGAGFGQGWAASGADRVFPAWTVFFSYLQQG